MDVDPVEYSPLLCAIAYFGVHVLPFRAFLPQVATLCLFPLTLCVADVYITRFSVVRDRALVCAFPFAASFTIPSLTVFVSRSTCVPGNGVYVAINLITMRCEDVAFYADQ